MAYFNNDNNASFYPTFSSPEELDACQVLSQMSVIEEPNLANNTFSDLWNTCEQSGPIDSSRASLWATANQGKRYCNPFVERCLTVESSESFASASSCVTQSDDNGQPLYPGNYWPTDGHQSHPYNSYPGLGDPFAGMVASEASTIVPTPSSGKNPVTLECRGTSTDRS